MPFKEVGKVICAAATGSSCIICNSDGNVFTWGSIVLGLGPKIQELMRPMLINTNLFSTAAGDDGKVEWVSITSTFY